MKPSFNNKIKCTSTQSILGEQMPPTLYSRFILTDDSLQMTLDLISLWKQEHLYSIYSMGIAFGNVKNRDETYKYNIHDLNQLIFEFNDSETIQCINTTITTSDGNKILIECGGLSDGDNDPEGSILLVENNADNTLWKLYSTDFIHYDCYGDDTLNTMHFPRLDKMFSLNVEREFIRIDNINKYAYIASQYNNGIAILDIENLETNDIFSLGVHDLGFTGLDASEKDNNIGNDNDRDNPSFDTRSDDKGPKPESIIIGECSNGDTYVFIGLERVGGIMIYDITAIDMVKIYFVEYVNNRYFNIDYIYNIRHSENIGDIEPKTLIFITDNDINNGIACLFVAYAIRRSGIIFWILVCFSMQLSLEKLKN